MAENLDEEATKDEITANFDIPTAKRLGFRDGFCGAPGRPVSPFHDQQMAYFEGHGEGREQRTRVDEVCRAEGLGIEDVMRKAFDHYYRDVHGQD